MLKYNTIKVVRLDRLLLIIYLFVGVMVQEVTYKDVLKENLYFFSRMQVPNLPLRYNNISAVELCRQVHQLFQGRYC
jgi:hypothetical protein